VSSVLDSGGTREAPERRGWRAALGGKPEVALSIALFVAVVGGW
jgi:hypothetical protein